MSITQATFDNLTRALTDLKFPSLSFSQAELLVEHTGVPRLQQLIAGARVNEADDRTDLEGRVTAVRAHYTFLELGMRESTLPATIKVITAHGIAKVRLTVGDAMKGDQNAKSVLAGWLTQASAPTEGDLGAAAAAAASAPVSQPQAAQRAAPSPQHSARQPVHPTPLPPPAARTLPVERASSQSSRPSQAAERSADNGSTRSIQASERNGGAGSSRPSAPVAAERSQGNVSQFPARAASESREEFGPDDDGASQSAPRDVAARNARQYDQVCVFGRDRTGATALQFDCSTAPADNGGHLTINLSLARAKGARTQDGVDWLKKICLMLSPGECVLCLNVLMGVNREFRGAGHGRNNKKWFQMAESDPESDYAGSIFVSVADGADQRGCSIMPGDLAAAICIFQRAVLDQNRASQTKIEPISMRDIMRRVGAMYELARESEKARKEKRAARG